MILFFTTAYHVLLSQEIQKCREIVDITIQSINTQSSNDLEKYLSPNFEIAGQKGSIAKIVLKQLFEQLGETVTSKKEIGNKKNGNGLIFMYTISYSKMGDKTATFIFDEQNRLDKLELFKIEVKTLKNDVDVDSEKVKVKEIPFRLIG
ncbi:MAG: hypothetical protein ACFB0A_16560 [Croceivirga sp.]